jgi:hypothetical protein
MQASLQAKTISVVVKKELEAASQVGNVHSVFHRAANFLFDGRLVTICHEECGIPPNGIQFRTKSSFLQLGLKPGQRVNYHDTHVSVPEASCRVDLSSAELWSPFVARISSPVDDVRRRHNLGEAWNALDKYEDQHPSNAGFWCSNEDLVACLLTAIRMKNVQAARVEAAKLVGLGGGLTPAGDDFLLGLIAALWIDSDPIAKPLAMFVAKIASERTTLLAETFHRYAVHHFYSSPLHMLLQNLLWGTARESALAVERTLRIGATSGADTLRGVLLGLDRASIGTDRAAYVTADNPMRMEP